MLSVPHVIRERSNIIPINIIRNSNYDSKQNNEYSLKQNWFDPTKNSPPNDFMIKLHMRMTNYESKVDVIKDDNFDSE